MQCLRKSSEPEAKTVAGGTVNSTQQYLKQIEATDKACNRIEAAEPAGTRTQIAGQPGLTGSAVRQDPSPYHYTDVVAVVRSMLSIAHAVRTMLSARIFGQSVSSGDADPELKDSTHSLEQALREGSNVISQTMSDWNDQQEAQLALEALGWCQAIARQAAYWLEGKSASVIPFVPSVSHF